MADKKDAETKQASTMLLSCLHTPKKPRLPSQHQSNTVDNGKKEGFPSSIQNVDQCCACGQTARAYA
eukprot:14689879-Ditylum_brightwellii.AAC.1